jgi:hypothetical protein
MAKKNKNKGRGASSQDPSWEEEPTVKDQQQEQVEEDQKV